jgi:ribosomal protein S18 acetylase RimI-like enzyme
LQHVANLAIEGGDRPFLHVLDDNHSAIALYRKCGFTLRRQMCLAVLKKRA